MQIHELVAGLNPMQRQAVELGVENALILAGAGSGKTKVLTTRIAWLLANGMAAPSDILAVTFTNKAAREMRDRLSVMVPFDTSAMWVGTFHGIAHRILRLHAAEANLPKTFQIIDSQDQLSLIKRIIKEMGMDPETITPRDVANKINRQKEAGKRSNQVSRMDMDGDTLKIYVTYEARCQKEGLVDFGELLLRSVELLEYNTPLRNHYRARFAFILIDEFQDTNALQFRWLHALSDPDKRENTVFCVGDDDQSIYAFRGACVGNMTQFVKDYHVKQVIKLEQNYRSTSHILDAANAVIANNTERMGKNLWTDSGTGDRIALYNAVSDRDEARSITQEILTLKRAGMEFKDMAVLYRNNSQSRIIEQYLNANMIPYRIYGGLRFFDRAEVKDVTAYLRVLSNPDDTSILRIINTPTRGIGATTIERLVAEANQMGVTLWDVLTNPVPSAAAQRASHFVTLIDDMRLACDTLNLPDTVKTVIEMSGLKASLENARDRDIRLENLNEVVNAAQGYCVENDIDEDSPAFTIIEGGQMAPVDGFLANATLEADDKNEQDADPNCVQLMTVHASKGLEFDQVFLTGLEEGLFPHDARADEDPAKANSEERRLMYVAMTRAKKRLRISWCMTRMLYGQMRDNIRSQFIDEIPVEHIHELNPEAVSDRFDEFSQTASRGGSRGGYGYGAQPSGYSSAYGGSSGYGRQSTSSSSRWSGASRGSSHAAPPSGRAAADLNSGAWRNAGLKRASELKSASGFGMNAKRAAQTSAYDLEEGQMVEHPVFGRGKVMAILYADRKDDARARIRFASGEKELLLQIVWEQLKKC